MKTSHNELHRYEELLRWGTRLDPIMVEQAKLACRGLEIIQSGPSVIYAETAGSFAIMLSVQLENVSNEAIRVAAIRLEMPWFDGDFRWLEKLSSKDLREGGLCVLPACGPYGFEAADTLNHRFGRNFKLYPGDLVEGLLFGEGSASIPEVFSDLTQVPMQLVVHSPGGKSYFGKMNLVMSRSKALQAQQPNSVFDVK